MPWQCVPVCSCRNSGNRFPHLSLVTGTRVDVYLTSLAKGHIDSSKATVKRNKPEELQHASQQVWSSILPSWYSYCSWILRRGNWIWVTGTSENSARVQMLRLTKERNLLLIVYIFCWSNLGCYYSSLISSRWQEHQIYTGELLNTSFSTLFSIFSNITYLIFHLYLNKYLCSLYI